MDFYSINKNADYSTTCGRAVSSDNIGRSQATGGKVPKSKVQLRR
jgi:hypothetical protein